MRRLLTNWMVLSAMVLFFGTVSYAGDIKDVGLKVGERIPEFRAQDQSKRNRIFKDTCGPKGLVFIFHRSADW